MYMAVWMPTVQRGIYRPNTGDDIFILFDVAMYFSLFTRLGYFGSIPNQFEQL